MSEAQAEVVLDEARQEKAKEYARVRRRLYLVDLLLMAVYLILWLAFNLHTRLGDWVDGITSSPFLSIIIFAFVFGLPYYLIDFPLSFYSGYILPHRYDQSNQTLSNWILDQVKGLGVSGILGVIVLELVYWLLRTAPDFWWLYASGVLLVFNILLSMLVPILIAPLFYKFIPLEDEDLTKRLIALADKAGTKVRGVYRFDMSTRTKAANAAVMGLGSTRRIILGDTLLDEFTPDEIETVLAHELAHIVHKDMPFLVAISSILMLVSFWAAHLALSFGVEIYGLDGVGDPAGLPIFGLAVGVIGLIAMPASNAFSRWRERMADRYALETTGKPRSFASAMTRLANQNLGEVDPECWVVILLHSHPPIADRVAAAEAFAND